MLADIRKDPKKYPQVSVSYLLGEKGGMSCRTTAFGAGSVLLAFAVGALAGAAVALLYAPAAGEETRRRKLAQKARERPGRHLSAAVERGREAYDQARKETV